MKKTSQKKKKRTSRKKSPARTKSKKPKAVEKKPEAIQGLNNKKPQQPPQRKEPDKKTEEKRGVVKYIGIAGQFLREARMELKKVKWPTRKELLASTAMVIFLVLVVSLFLGLIDFGLIKMIKNIVG